jgi:type I restriction enzyme M protein
VLFRGQPEVEEETGELDEDGNPKVKRRKADDEHRIRRALLEARLVDAVISLPLNIFYGAGVPACLLILRKQRPAARRDQVLLVYAARHYRELAAKNGCRRGGAPLRHGAFPRREQGGDRAAPGLVGSLAEPLSRAPRVLE